MKHVRIYLTEKCNTSCPWCFNKKNRNNQNMDTEKCKKFSNDGKPYDENMHKLLGETLWQDLLLVANNELVNNLKVTITIEPDNDGK